MTLSRLRPLNCPAAEVNILDVVELSLEALAAELDLRHHAGIDGSDRRLPSAWIASVMTGHICVLRDSIATYKNARNFEEDERLF